MALKAKLRLSIKDEYNPNDPLANSVEQVVYLGYIPFMTHRGTFIINGAERIIVSQLHRSPGVFFDEISHPNGTRLYSARIIPLRGSWVEFATDINELMIVYIDRRKKFLVTTLLRAIGISSDRDILSTFNLIQETEISTENMEELVGMRVVEDIIDRNTGEIIMDKLHELTLDKIQVLINAGITKLELIRSDKIFGPEIISNTLIKDQTHSQDEALETIYMNLRSGEAPDLDTARQLIERLFFNPKRYDLGEVGPPSSQQEAGFGSAAHYHRADARGYHRHHCLPARPAQRQALAG